MSQPLIALDQCLNTLIHLKGDGWGYADEMLSSRAYRLRGMYPWLIYCIDHLFFWDKYHCQECYGIEMARSQLPIEYRILGQRLG